jgi:uncharacterized protein YacL
LWIPVTIIASIALGWVGITLNIGLDLVFVVILSYALSFGLKDSHLNYNIKYVLTSIAAYLLLLWIYFHTQLIFLNIYIGYPLNINDIFTILLAPLCFQTFIFPLFQIYTYSSLFGFLNYILTLLSLIFGFYLIINHSNNSSRIIFIDYPEKKKKEDKEESDNKKEDENKDDEKKE